MNSVSYKNITARLQGVFRRYILTGLAEAFWVSFAAGIWLTVLFSLYESFMYFPPHVKKFLFFTIFACSFFTFCIVFLIRYIRRPGIDDIARMVERAFPHLGDRLISAVQLGGQDETSLGGQSRRLVDVLVKKVDEETKTIDMARAVSARRLVAWLRIACVSLIVSLSCAVAFPARMLGALYRITDYSHEYIRPGGISIYTLNRDGSIIRGENFSTAGFVSGGAGQSLSVLYCWDDSDVWSMKPVEFDERIGSFTVTIEKPRASFQYCLEMGSYSTPGYRITVIERPVVEKLALSVKYPDYTGLGTVDGNDNDGNIRAPEGSKVTLKVIANKPLSSMVLNWSDSTVTECAVDGISGETAFTVAGDIGYHIGLVDTMGITNINPISYRISCLKDENPAVTILSPASDIVLPRTMRFPVVYRAWDDFGLSEVTLAYKLPYENAERVLTLKKSAGGKDILDEYMWELSGADLLPDDSITYFITVYDNDTVNGPKKGVSGTRTVRVPSLTDLLSKSVDEQEKGLEKLRGMSERTGRQSKELESLRRNIRSGRKMDWSEKNALDDATGNLENMQKELRELSDAIKETAGRLSEEDIAAIETMEKMNKVSELMDELADGYMKEALKRLARAAAEIDPEKINKALEEYEITAEAIKEKLDRFINLLEQVMIIQRFEMAKRILEEISFRQSEIAGQFEQLREPSNLGREQETLASEMKNLEDELKDLAKDMKEQFSLDTESLESQAASHDISESMNETAGQISENKKTEAGQNFEKINKKLSDLLETVNNLDSTMRSRNSAEMRKRLFKAALELLAVSHRQERLIGEIGSTDPENIARQELEIIDGLQKARRSLVEFSSIFVEVSGALDMLMESAGMSAGGALDSFASGSAEGGKQKAVNTLSAINRTVLFLTMLLDNSSSNGQGMPGDLLDQLQKIASGQLSLNMQMNAGMPEDMLARLAAEQEKLAQMLSELNQKLLSDKQLREMLDKLAEDMDDAASMMRMNEDRELVGRKQLDIYRRLLDARRSRREKGEERERKSWTAKRDFSLGADELAQDRGERKRELNERIKRAMKDDFNPEYMRLIRRYFESMLSDSLDVVVQ